MTLLASGPLVAPRFRTGPKPHSLEAAHEAVELAASAGLILDPWQVADLEHGLGERVDGKWAAREVAEICPRQNGKGSIIEAIELAGLFLFGEDLILHSAHEFKTAQEAFRRIWGLIEATPDLEQLVYRKLQNNNDLSIELKSGQRLRFVARTGGSGRGFSGDRIILDEAFNLPDRAVSALFFTMSARPNPQVWYTSSAPLLEVYSTVLRRICKRGRSGDPGLAYTEYCALPGADLDDREAWAQANPGFPHRISEETIVAERAMVLDEDFARERLGLWLTDEDLANRVIPADAWLACVDPAHEHRGPLAYALDVSPDGASASVGVSDGCHLEVVKHGEGTAWVVPECDAHKGGFAELVMDSAGPAGALVAPLEAAGVTVRQVTSREHQAACGSFLTAVMDGTVRHLDQPVLNAATANADRRDIGDGGWLWSRKRSSVDISPLVAVTLARWAATQGRHDDPLAMILGGS